MAFTDPQSLTIGGTATSLPRTGFGPSEGSFRSADGQTTFVVRHSAGKRTRHNVLVRQDKTVADPLIPSQNRPVSFQASLTLDLPNSGVAAADVLALAKALVTWASDANLAKMVGGES